MALRLQQTSVNCPTCGFYLWKIYNIVYDANSGRATETLDGTVCTGCEAAKWLDVIPNAIKFEPIVEPKQRLKTDG